jgi:hypothetical protein
MRSKVLCEIMIYKKTRKQKDWQFRDLKSYVNDSLLFYWTITTKKVYYSNGKLIIESIHIHHEIKTVKNTYQITTLKSLLWWLLLYLRARTKNTTKKTCSFFLLDCGLKINQSNYSSIIYLYIHIWRVHYLFDGHLLSTIQ